MLSRLTLRATAAGAWPMIIILLTFAAFGFEKPRIYFFLNPRVCGPHPQQDTLLRTLMMAPTLYRTLGWRSKRAAQEAASPPFPR